MKYLAYGSNLDKGQMKQRCPYAKPLGKLMIPNYRLVFRGVADIIPAKGFQVPVGVWEITERCEASLDMYEGVSHGLYRKEYFHSIGKQFWGETETDFLTYVMNRDGLRMPPHGYLEGIQRGYRDFGIDQRFLEEALDFTKNYDTGDGHIPARYRTGG